MILYFTGIDGSGKTSLVDEVEKFFLENNTGTMRIWARYSPWITRMFVDIFKKRSINRTGNYNTISAEDYSKWKLHKKRLANNKFLRLALFSLFSLEYFFQIAGTLMKIRKHNNRIILIDRFVIDFLVDQTINFGDLSGTWIFRKLIEICDSFNAVFFISVRPEIALGRKNDIPGLGYLNDRDKCYREIINEMKCVHYVIDNNSPPEVAINEILKIIRK